MRSLRWKLALALLFIDSCSSGSYSGYPDRRGLDSTDYPANPGLEERSRSPRQWRPDPHGAGYTGHLDGFFAPKRPDA